MTDPENGKRKTDKLFVIERFSEWNGFHRKCPDILAEQQNALYASRKEEDMEYRKIPGTDMKLSVVVFGSWANGGWSASERTDAVKAVQASYRAGVTSFDTAPLYGLGDAETIIGEAIECLPRDKIQILTKFGLRWGIKGGIPFSSMTNAAGNPVDIVRHAGRDSVIAECEGSLKRLKTEYIDLYQLHWPDDTTPMDDTCDAVQMVIELGPVR